MHVPMIHLVNPTRLVRMVDVLNAISVIVVMHGTIVDRGKTM